jgi:hypothetical protein
MIGCNLVTKGEICGLLEMLETSELLETLWLQMEIFGPGICFDSNKTKKKEVEESI